MDILDKYTLVPRRDGIDVVEIETSKKVYFLKEGFDFSTYTVGNILTIGCVTLDITTSLYTDTMTAFNSVMDTDVQSLKSDYISYVSSVSSPNPAS
jgi:hypothetical protein